MSGKWGQASNSTKVENGDRPYQQRGGSINGKLCFL